MALTTVQLATVGVVVLVLLLVILVNNLAAARSRKAALSAPAAGAHALVAKFAHHEGKVVGETVAVDGDRLILKQSGTFKAVPLAQAQEKDGEVQVSGAIDWAAAEAAGKAWHQSHRAAADATVSGALTRSEDVKAPALESLRERQGKGG